MTDNPNRKDQPMTDDKHDKPGLQWRGEESAPPPRVQADWEILKAQCELAADLYDDCAEKAGSPRPLSVEHALYMIAFDWYNNMTMCGGLQRFESALAKARPGGTKQILR